LTYQKNGINFPYKYKLFLKNQAWEKIFFDKKLQAIHPEID